MFVFNAHVCWLAIKYRKERAGTFVGRFLVKNSFKTLNGYMNVTRWKTSSLYITGVSDISRDVVVSFNFHIRDILNKIFSERKKR